MIDFEEKRLSNGLKVIVHRDPNTHVAVLNIAYNVGSRDESPEHTGFAHLFEHLMFGGSVNIPSYDEPLQKVGGENNAFTTPDITNYYLTVPANNIETGFWLESDRMLSLSFDPDVLEVQRKVVIEEFKQRYLNQPYGDVWHKLRNLAYQEHPYRWPTIGEKIEHIEEATMQQVKDFFKKFYIPNNATLVIAGNVDIDKSFAMAEKWFGPIPAGEPYFRNLPKEPEQKLKRRLEVSASVPVDAFYKVYHMAGKTDQAFYRQDLLSDILGRSKSSRLHKELVIEKHIFANANSYILGSADPGLLVFSGKLADGVDFEQAEEAVDNLTQTLITEGVTDEELSKVKNQAISTLLFGEVEVLNRAMNLAYYDVMNDVNRVNQERDHIEKVSKDQIIQAAQAILKEENSSVMYYKAKN